MSKDNDLGQEDLEKNKIFSVSLVEEMKNKIDRELLPSNRR